MKLKAITYNYNQDGILCNKVVGIFDEGYQLESALNNIRNTFGEHYKLVVDKYDKSCDNYFLEFDDENKSYFYTSDYIVGELYL
jgi:hypothetical protein